MTKLLNRNSSHDFALGFNLKLLWMLFYYAVSDQFYISVN